MKKIKLEGLEGSTLEFAKAHNDLVDRIEALDTKSDNSGELATLKQEIADLKAKEVKSYDEDIVAMKAAITTLEDQAKKTPKTPEYKTLALDIQAQLESLGCKNLAEFKKLGKKDFELKADTILTSGANTGTIGRTNMDAMPTYAPVRRLAFVPFLKTVTEGTDKSIFGYTEASYTSNAGYVTEGTGSTSSDEASAAEKTRSYAKISAYLHITEETFEDIPAFANTLAAKLEEGAMLFVDQECYSGTGSATTIYGINKAATAFDSVSYAGTVELKANLADLVEAIKTQIAVAGQNRYTPSVVWMNPIDYFKLRVVKDSTGQPIFNADFFGNPKLAGLNVATSTAVTVNTLTVADANVIEFRTKRALKMQMGQILTGDVLNDRQSAILFMRAQVLIRDIDKVAVVKVASITDELANLNASI